jgi:hypothetical protein
LLTEQHFATVLAAAKVYNKSPNHKKIRSSGQSPIKGIDVVLNPENSRNNYDPVI